MTQRTFGSLFAGVGGFDLGFETAGWEARWQVEWDARCQSVLARHWPEVTRYGDVCDVGVVPLGGRPDDGRDGLGSIADVDGRQSARGVLAPAQYGDVRDVMGGMGLLQHEELGAPGPHAALEPGAGDRLGVPVVGPALLSPVDCITYGFPCQDLSVAGRRAGLDGDRSNLFFQAIRIIKEMRDATGGRYPTWAVAENVPGLLNADGGAAMGRCLDALADVGAVDIEWGVLDAQYFGVPQRRRRVFIVAGFRAGALGAGPLLPLAESSSGDHRSSDPAWEGASRDAAPSFDDRALRPRRLTPRECERLMGWPDDHTRWAADGREIADNTRYRMCGNGVAAPVAEWVARRLADHAARASEG